MYSIAQVSDGLVSGASELVNGNFMIGVIRNITIVVFFRQTLEVRGKEI